MSTSGVVSECGAFVQSIREHRGWRLRYIDSATEERVLGTRVYNFQSFALSKCEVTFEEYAPFAAATGRRTNDEGRGRRPVINVSWDDAVAYTEWLSEQTGKWYRLPSEAEWEYAACLQRGAPRRQARARTTTRHSWGDDIGRNLANCDGCGSQWDDKETAPVGSFPANAWGLHDMHGNVWEWVQDCWNGNYEGAPVDGSAWESGDCSRRVLRGGSWNDTPRILRAAYRFRGSFGGRGDDFGFRIVRMLTP